MEPKLITALTLEDFINNPIWTWFDDDTDLVIPVIYRDFLPEDHDALFIYCQLELKNGSKASGVISVRVSNREVYVITFIGQNKSLLDFPLQKMFKSDSNISSLTNFLGKNMDEIFPLKYKTIFSFSDGQRLEGEIFY